MLRIALACMTACAVLLAAAFSLPGTTSAESVIRRALKTAPAEVSRVGAYTWLEDYGIGVKLAPAARQADFPRLLAGDAPENQAIATALWDLGPDGVAALKRNMEAKGARFESGTGLSLRPKAFPQDIAGHWTRVDLGGGRNAGVLDFTANGFNFALVFSAEAGAEAGLPAFRETFLRDFVLLPGMQPGSCAPLIFEGRYACVLKGWQRVGERFYATVNQSWLGLRLFHVAETDHESLDALTTALETELTAASFRPAPGSRPDVAGTQAFLREYYREDGYVQRILYARLNGGYLVALAQAPVGLRDQLTVQVGEFVAGITPLEFGGVGATRPLYFNDVRNVRIVAWQDGRRVLWGALFDDGRRQQVLWRQDDVAWNVRAVRNGEIIASRNGLANSSKALNPLVDAELRALDLMGEWTGALELELEVAGERSKTTLNVR